LATYRTTTHTMTTTTTLAEVHLPQQMLHQSFYHKSCSHSVLVLAQLENICHHLCTLSRKTTSMNTFTLPAHHRHKAKTKATLPFVGGKPQFHQEFYTAAQCHELCLEVVTLQQSIHSMLPPPQQQQQQQLRPPANLATLHSSLTPSLPVMPDVESPLFPAGAVPVLSTLGWTSPWPSVPLSSLPSIPCTCQQCGMAKMPEWCRGPHGSQMCVLPSSPSSKPSSS
jgi:hypothetical protein